MKLTGPFQDTRDIVLGAGLLLDDVGYWCLLVDGCYHLFSYEQQAIRAHESLLRGIHVR